MICEMFAYYKTRKISLIDKLNEIYKNYGYCLNTLHSYEFDGSEGMKKIKDIMTKFREGLSEIGDYKVNMVLDYSNGIDDLPKSDVLKYLLDCGSVVVRPSGTEPKLKAYISVTANNKEEAWEIERKINQEMNKYMQN